MANRTLEILRAFLGWCVDQDWMQGNPAADIKKPTKETARTRVLSDDELIALWRATDTCSPQARAAIRLLLLTGQREMEVVGARWNEIDTDKALWTLPLEEEGRSKRTSVHMVPLTGPALGILADMRAMHPDSETVFRGKRRGDKGGKPSRFIVTHAYADLFDALAFGEDWRIHDLRRTMRTSLSRLGVAPHVAELCIGHSIKGIMATYDRWAYLTERRDAMQRWADFLLELVGEKKSDSAKVVALDFSQNPR